MQIAMICKCFFRKFDGFFSSSEVQNLWINFIVQILSDTRDLSRIYIILYIIYYILYIIYYILYIIYYKLYIIYNIVL